MQGWVDLVVLYIPRWYTRPKTVTHPSTNRARLALASFMRRTPLTTTPRRQPWFQFGPHSQKTGPAGWPIAPHLASDALSTTVDANLWHYVTHSASGVTTLWRYTNLFIIIIITPGVIFGIFGIPVVYSWVWSCKDQHCPGCCLSSVRELSGHAYSVQHRNDNVRQSIRTSHTTMKRFDA